MAPTREVKMLIPNNKKEPQKNIAVVNSSIENKQEVNQDQESQQSQEQPEVTIQDVLINFEQRLQSIESALFRMRGAI